MVRTAFWWTAYLVFLISCTEDPTPDSDWDTYLGDASSSQYSNLHQINNENISLLGQAWSYSSGDVDTSNRSQIQCNPLVIDGILYGTSARLKLFSLDAATGEELWVFDPFEGAFGLFGAGVNRGLVYYAKDDDKRIFYSAGSFLYAVNATDGKLIETFGDGGKIDLHKGLGRNVEDMFIVSNTPGIIYKDLLIMGSRVSESTGAAPGHIRAFDVNTGLQRWIFHTIPHPGEFGYDTWPEDAYERIGGANVWAGFSLDQERGIVYCPTGSAAYDFYGGDRHGANLFANCILALDAATGERIWHYQTIHHDIWDKDLPAPPNLVTVKKDGALIDAVAQITKNGFLFVLDRETGEPLYPVEEVEVPDSDLVGEAAWPTQPVPTHYPFFSRIHLAEDDLAQRSEEAATFARHIWDSSRKGSPFIPPSEQGTLIFPGFDGGGEWGGAAYDPETGHLIINSNEMVWRSTMDPFEPASPGKMMYRSLCQSCHGENLEGNLAYGNVPSLIDLDKRLSLAETEKMILKGKGIMPAFTFLNSVRIKSIYDFINGIEEAAPATMTADWPYPYTMRGYEKLYAPDGYPMITPPWGQLTAIDLHKAQIVWQVPLGEHEALSDSGMDITGTENYGGPVVTAGNVLFIAATLDEKIRAFDKRNGQLLWQSELPASGYATPATYIANGEQYVVIACGGGKLGTKSGDQYVAFKLLNSKM